VLRAPEPPRVATGIHIAGRPSSISGDSSIPDRIEMLQLVRILSGIIARSSQDDRVPTILSAHHDKQHSDRRLRQDCL
jgi:hypothetical protein